MRVCFLSYSSRVTFQRKEQRGREEKREKKEKKDKETANVGTETNVLVQSGHVSISRRCRSSVSVRGVGTRRNASSQRTQRYLICIVLAMLIASQNAV